MELLKETLKSISSPDEVAKEEAKKRLDNLAKP
ncbi:MAG: nicotinate-nucleotide--dimethylbenzimidazole phosphoribosyltransferase, partial [Tissierellia bacterium]|nr:nicotinate-nucleotide--dimethylbenzimidazole phosphoribosyltransferase [Tissierellia bacterium]